jgi:integrase
MAKAWELADRGELGAVAALCALLLGMRAGEIIERQVRDLDDGGRLLWIPSSKTEADRRTLEIPEPLQPYLRRLAADRQPEDLLFGRHWCDWPREWVQRICDMARVPRVTVHGMRGMHSTLALQAGTSGHVVAASLGHESISTTLQSYANPAAVESAKRHRALTVLQGGGGENRKGETKNAGEFVSPAFPQ